MASRAVANVTPNPVAPAPSSAGPGMERLTKLLCDLKVKDENVRLEAAKSLRLHLAESARDMTTEAFSKYNDVINKKIFEMFTASDSNEKLGGIAALSELMNLDMEANANKFVRFSNLLRVLMPCQDVNVMVEASRAVGKLVLSGGDQTSNFVSFEMTSALEWLDNERREDRRMAAVLILRVLADSAPSVFFSFIAQFIQLVWYALRDKEVTVRERAAESLRSAINVINRREGRLRTQYYRSIYEQIDKGFKSNNSEWIHGSLIAAIELIPNCDDFLKESYAVLCDTVLKLREKSDKLIRKAVVQLLPSLAAYYPEEFVRERSDGSYISITMNHLFTMVKKEAERGIAFISMGRLADALGANGIQSYISRIIAFAKECLVVGKKAKNQAVGEALMCTGHIVKILHEGFNVYVDDLMDALFSTGLTEELLFVLEQMATNMLSMLSVIQVRLLDLISNILSGSPFTIPSSDGPASARHPSISALSPKRVSSKANLKKTLQQDAAPNQQEVQLALATLGRFSFSGHLLLNFVKEVVVQYTNNDDPVLRKEAVYTAAKLLLRGDKIAGETGSQFKPTASIRETVAITAEVLERLVSLGVSDPDPSIREAVLRCMDARFDAYLVQPENLKCLFIALNDESFKNRLLAIHVVGRLTIRNPAYVMPTLRKFTIQLLTELEFSGEYRMKEESALLISQLIQSCPLLAKPYTDIIVNSLVPKLDDPMHRATDVTSNILSALGHLAEISQDAMCQYIPRLMPVIQEPLQDQRSESKRWTAFRVLGQLGRSTGDVVSPYLQYPNLLNIILSALRTETSRHVRREVLKVLGILGALDPYHHKVLDLNVRTKASDRSASSSSGVEQDAADTYTNMLANEVRLELPSTTHTTTQAAATAQRSEAAQNWISCAKLLIASAGFTEEMVNEDKPQGDGTEAVTPTTPMPQPLQSQQIVKEAPPKPAPSLTELLWNNMGYGAGIEDGGWGGVPIGASASDSRVHAPLPARGSAAEEYFPTVAINALVDILRDKTLGQYHTTVVQSLMLICKNLRLRCVPYLPQIMPPLMSIIEECESGFRDFLFKSFGTLVSIVKQHIRDYLPRMFAIMNKFWDSHLVHVLSLIREVSLALSDEFKNFVPELLTTMISHLFTVDTAPNDAMLELLKCLESFGSNLQEYISLVLPYLIRVAENSEASIAVRVAALRTLGKLCRILDLSDYASRIVHPLARLLGSIAELQIPVMDTLAQLMVQLQSDYIPFAPLVNVITARHRIRHSKYDAILNRIIRGEALPQSMLDELDKDKGPSYDMEQDTAQPSVLRVNQNLLKKSWDTSQKSTKDEWLNWMKQLSLDLLRESPSPALRSCSALAQSYIPLATKMFNASFVSCWSELYENYQEDLVRSIEFALTSSTIPLSVLQSLLNLAEFMEHDEKALPIDIVRLGGLADKCQAYAKALRYKESEFQQNPKATIESLISLNNQLQQPEAAEGILTYARENLQMQLKEGWYEKLRRWDKALDAYERRAKEDPFSLDITMGRMRCLNALGEWKRLNDLSSGAWRKTSDEATYTKLAPIAASAAWHLEQWDDLKRYVDFVGSDSEDGLFFRAMIAVHEGKFNDAEACIEQARDLLDTTLTALVGESYSRAYDMVVRAQELAEIEELILYCQGDNDTRYRTTKLWEKRLVGVERNVDVWQRLLSVHSVVLRPENDVAMKIKFASLCRKNNRVSMSDSILKELMPKMGKPTGSGIIENTDPKVGYAMLKHKWDTTSNLTEKLVLIEQLNKFAAEIQNHKASDPRLQARVYLKLGKWNLATRETLDDNSIALLMECFRRATQHDTKMGKAWHAWALFNFQVLSHYEHVKGASDDHDRVVKITTPYIVAAVRGFFNSIHLGASSSSKGLMLQDTLRLLSLFFTYGNIPEVEEALQKGFTTVDITTWLDVIPQMIARLSQNTNMYRMLSDLLKRIGKAHPHALVYPLTVATKAPSTLRVAAATNVVESMRAHSAKLVQQAELVSKELIRVAILWYEMWHEGLEEASRQYFTMKSLDGMLAVLKPLHAMLEKGGETQKEQAFIFQFSRDLQEAQSWCNSYAKTKKQSDISQAWDLYYHVFRAIAKLLPEMTQLELKSVSPALTEAYNLQLTVPGTYRANKPIVTISSFVPKLTVIGSKQRPRRLTIIGSDGLAYMYLLKGHEDLRQDERVMQLFGLVNMLLAQDPSTSKHHLTIMRYPVIPLSQNSGVLGWVTHCDTIHALIKDYRESRKIVLNGEHKLILNVCPFFDHATVLQKVEAYQYAMVNTQGRDLYSILWLKSPNSEAWLDRRTTYTRSHAVMCMVGYLLGLGDRHPSNLMLHRFTGKVMHIDFGDCFETAMVRDKYPERIPFRLTRMMVNAMEVSGIEGNFRVTCERVMRVLRENKDSLMAVMETFVHDPLINWRLLTTHGQPSHGDGDESQTLYTTTTRVEPSAEDDTMNSKAVEVIGRVEAKLTGRDFDSRETLSVAEQVDLLIRQATSTENLSQCYVGWCAFW